MVNGHDRMLSVAVSTTFTAFVQIGSPVASRCAVIGGERYMEGFPRPVHEKFNNLLKPRKHGWFVIRGQIRRQRV